MLEPHTRQLSGILTRIHEPQLLLLDLPEEETRRYVILPLLIASDMILRTKEPLSHLTTNAFSHTAPRVSLIV